MIAAATLLLTSLSLTGLISLWAARSPIHWFFRAAVFVAAMSMLLLIPAYEPFVAFTVQGAVVAVGIQLARWQQWSIDGRSARHPRAHFSVLTCLLVTALLAIAAAVAVRLPSLGYDVWLNVVMIGAVSGVATLIGVWVAGPGRSRRWLSAAVGLVCCLVISLALARFDFFLESLVNSYSVWPPTEEDSFAWAGTSLESYDMVFAWASIVVGIMSVRVAAVWLMTGLAKSSRVTDGRSPIHGSPPKPWIARYGLLVLVSVLAAPPAFVYYKLITPLPIPAMAGTNPSGWTDIVAAGRMAENSGVNSTISFYDTSSPAQLAAAVKAMRPVYERLDRGLKEDFQYPLEYS